MKETIFEKSIVPLYLGVVLQLIVLSVMLFATVGLLKKQNYEAIIILNLSLIILCLFLWHDLSKRGKIKFFDEGFSVIRYFRRRFILWKEIDKVTSDSVTIVMSLKKNYDASRNFGRTVRIGFLWYKNPDDVKKFIAERLGCETDL